MKTRVGIAGTSGAIMAEGWRAAFEAAAPEFDVVANASLGSSHPAMLPYRLPLLEDAGLDVLLVDLCVNEQRALGRNLHSPDWARDGFAWLRGWCADRGVLPVVLILPALGEAGMAGSPVADGWAAMCRDAGLPWLDGYRLIRHGCFYTRQPPRHFFLNANHLNARGTRLVAEALARTLPQFLMHATIGAATGPAPDLRFVHAGGRLERQTALVAERLLRLTLGEAHSVQTGPGEVAGVVHDMARASGALLMTGARARAKRLDTPHLQPDGPLRLVAWSLIERVPAAEDGHVVLSVQPSRLLAGQEDNDHTKPDAAPGIEDPTLEIAGLIMRDEPAERRLIAAQGITGDLLSLLD
ncbi:hypothetical protein MLD63_04910 [Paracoccus sp. TK19116]|uniref:SGNH hydrolase-type esterase domain-containing protein n=1 Tax=Paracoccus albicereus TaxID=2922394 RepID=A0ABT1MNA9_9RHOB|nr:hypothetical protein [Paracoccus albicereus]MCQ0969767.1 hypothetical protein [Paracoccus albicereus]